MARRLAPTVLLEQEALLTQGTVIPDGMLAFGSPAKVIRPLTDAEKKENQTNGHQLHADEKCTKKGEKT